MPLPASPTSPASEDTPTGCGASPRPAVEGSSLRFIRRSLAVIGGPSLSFTRGHCSLPLAAGLRWPIIGGPSPSSLRRSPYPGGSD